MGASRQYFVDVSSLTTSVAACFCSTLRKDRKTSANEPPSLFRIQSGALTRHGQPSATAVDPDVHVAIPHLGRLAVHRTDQELRKPYDRGIAERLDDELVEP